MVPKLRSGKKFIKEIRRMMNLWTDNTPLENTA